MSKNVLYVQIFLLALILIGCEDEKEVSSEDKAEAIYMEDYEGPAFKWGFLDMQGDIAIKAQYDQVSGFTEGLAAANLKGRWGYIDRDGDVVIPFDYLASWPFSNGLARVTLFSGEQCFINTRGELNCPDKAIELGDYHGGLMAMITEGGEGYIDNNGNVIVDPILDQAGQLNNGYAVVVLQGSQGLIDSTGEIVVPTDYDKVFPPTQGIVCVKQADVYFYIDLQTNERVNSHEYSRAQPYHDGLAVVKSVEGEWQLVDRSGIRVDLPEYQTLIYRGNGRWIARKPEGFGLIDGIGRELTDFKYQQINMFIEGLAVYRRDGLCGFLDQDGREVTPPQYGIAWDFSEGLARAAFRDGIAFVDKNGQVPFLPDYFELRDFSEGLAPFQDE